MLPAPFEFASLQPRFDCLPINLEQHASKTSALMRLCLLVPALVAMLIPLALVAAHAASAPSALMVLGDKPLAALQLTLAFTLWAGLFVLPTKRLISRIGSARSVRIDAQTVTVVERHPFASRTWTAPLSQFAGITHHVRTSLSGTRRELVLVHPMRKKSVLLAAADCIPEAMVRNACDLLRMPEVPAHRLYGLDLPFTGRARRAIAARSSPEAQPA